MTKRTFTPDTDPEYLDQLAAGEPPEDQWQKDAVSAPLPFFTIPADFNPASIPQRDWIVPGLLLRGYITAVLAPGGAGKSSHALITAVAMASGKDILGQGIGHKSRVAVINNEDDRDELMRRCAAICLHHDIQFGEVTENLKLCSGYGHLFAIAKEIDGMVVATPVKGKLISYIKEHAIDVVMIDPFISTHESEENNNNAIDKVIGVFKEIMQETGSAFLVSHHTRKSNADSEAHAGNVESGRGAKSMTDAARVAVTLARMSTDTAERLGIEWEQGRRLVRLDDAKKNYSLSDEESQWFRMASVKLPNGDWVGVPEPYDIEPHIKSSQKTDVKWTATAFAEVIDSVCKRQPDTGLIRWANIRGPIANQSGLSESRTNHLVSLLSQKKSEPTRILIGKSYVNYWIQRDGKGKTAPWVIHREELS